MLNETHTTASHINNKTVENIRVLLKYSRSLKFD